MDFSPPPRVAALLPEVDDFVRRSLFPLEAAFVGQPFSASLPALEAQRAEVKRRGWWTPQMPTELGGMGLSLVEHAWFSEILGQSPIGHFVFNCQAPDAGNMEILHRFGTDAQKATWLEPLVRGDFRSCFSMTEPEHPGSNPTWLGTTAVHEGDELVINGHKWFTSSADGARFAIVMAVTNPEAPPHLRASQIIVPTDTPGFIRVRNLPVMGHGGDGYPSHAEIRYENCRVPVDNLLGTEGAGFVIAQERLGPGRIHHCMRWLGICARAFSLMCERALSRELKPGEPLGHKQIIQAWIAESRAEIDAARLLVLHCAWKIEKVGAGEAREEISCIKFYVADVLGKVLDRAIQTHGALGLLDDTPLAYFFRHERGARIYDGPDEVHKMLVARRILSRTGESMKR